MKRFYHIIAIMVVLSSLSSVALAQTKSLSELCDEQMTAVENEGTKPSQIVAVDLGLPSGLKWATCNIGASSPEEYGDYFAWGETVPKDNFNRSNYKWYNEENDSYTRYNTYKEYGEVDDKREFRDYNYEDDVARSRLGGNWRVPTWDEWLELEEKCTWTWTEQNGINGYKVTGSNGQSIFLPAAGRRWDADLDWDGSNGYYWSSSLYKASPDYAWGWHLSSYVLTRDSDRRFLGESIRPVTE